MNTKRRCFFERHSEKILKEVRAQYNYIMQERYDMVGVMENLDF